jgi:phosphoribosyl 1,2-cyclic phosphate phosphodiesterase
LTDVSRIPAETIDRIRGVELLVLDALRDKPHPTHLSFEQAIAIAKEIGAGRTLLTHFSHSATHRQIMDMMPKGIEPAYDGMEIILDER